MKDIQFEVHYSLGDFITKSGKKIEYKSAKKHDDILKLSSWDEAIKMMTPSPATFESMFRQYVYDKLSISQREASLITKDELLLKFQEKLLKEDSQIKNNTRLKSIYESRGVM